jgi:hypothetical protein
MSIKEGMPGHFSSICQSIYQVLSNLHIIQALTSTINLQFILSNTQSHALYSNIHEKFTYVSHSGKAYRQFQAPVLPSPCASYAAHPARSL